MSSSERPNGPIRQLSLQQQSSRRHQHVRRQKSADNDECLNAIRLKLNSGLMFNDKPKLRIAWGETKPKSSDLDGDQVQIIARQISSKKAVGDKGPKKANILDKPSILYSHQELAERLRLAWKQREERKANIDIFLARNTREEQSVPERSTDSTNTAQSASKVVDNISNEFDSNETFQIYVPTFDNVLVNEESAMIRSFSNNNVGNDKNEEKENTVLQQNNQNLTKKLLDKKKSETDSFEQFRSDDHSKTQIKTTEMANSLKPERPSTEDPFSQAKLKRAGFRSGANKAFVGPIAETPVSSEKEKLSKQDEISHNNTILEDKLKRTVSSAPSQRRHETPNRSNVEKCNSIEKAEEKSAIPNCDSEPIKSCVRNRPLKSASLKKRVKYGKRRGFSIGSSKDNVCKNRSKLGDSKSNDLVTMVSLVSSADSESDVDEQTDNKLIHALRNKLPTTPIIKSSVKPACSVLRRPIKSVSFHQSSIDDNSVSKEDIGEEKSASVSNLATDVTYAETSSLAWKPDVDLELPLLQHSQDLVNNEIPLMEREKRCLVVPIGDLRDKKRKVQRTRSAGPRLIEMSCPPIHLQESFPQVRSFQSNSNISHPNTIIQDSMSVKVTETYTPMTMKLDQKVNIISPEPALQTSKEKECWHLYRRMCDKGVCVSFDTVLRGMLTPTEYRLRQKNEPNDVK